MLDPDFYHGRKVEFSERLRRMKFLSIGTCPRFLAALGWGCQDSVSARLGCIINLIFTDGRTANEAVLRELEEKMLLQVREDVLGKSIRLERQIDGEEMTSKINSRSGNSSWAIADLDAINAALGNISDPNNVSGDVAINLFKKNKLKTNNLFNVDYLRDCYGCNITVVGPKGKETVKSLTKEEAERHAERGSMDASDFAREEFCRSLLIAIYKVNDNDMAAVCDTIANIIEGYLGQNAYFPLTASIMTAGNRYFTISLGDSHRREKITVSKDSLSVLCTIPEAKCDAFLAVANPRNGSHKWVLTAEMNDNLPEKKLAVKIEDFRLDYSLVPDSNRRRGHPNIKMDTPTGKISFLDEAVEMA
jgi:hypothetical protein